jgi:hypothetical protein
VSARKIQHAKSSETKRPIPQKINVILSVSASTFIWVARDRAHAKAAIAVSMLDLEKERFGDTLAESMLGSCERHHTVGAGLWSRVSTPIDHFK